MNVKNALAAIRRPKERGISRSLYTPWGEAIHTNQTEAIWQEYPRPTLRRANFTILNGKWDYAFFSEKNSFTAGASLPSSGKILVPFSPEAPLSGVGRQLSETETLWYERKVHFSTEELSAKAKGERCILHFEAVDQIAVVYVNGVRLLSHEGGYLPFEVDITESITTEDLLLQVEVTDSSDTGILARGKQSLKPGGIFYTAQSGIWQSVWYEWVPHNYIRHMQVTPNLENGSVKIVLDSDKEFASVTCTVYRADKQYQFESQQAKHPHALIGVALTRQSSSPNELLLTLPSDSLFPWTPEEPFLYGFTIVADQDTVHGYFGLRSFSLEPDETGVPRFCLNHKPYFLNGVLDQGYWSDGLMTAPCDEALQYDINFAKRKQFNTLRKHLKIESERFYYHCDRLGMIVWQDMVNGGVSYKPLFVSYLPTLFPHLFETFADSHYKLLSRPTLESRSQFEKECMETIAHLYNVPSLAVWSLFNEGFGQFDALSLSQKVKAADPSRLVDHASGWFDQKGGDFKSIHNYFRKLKMPSVSDRAVCISEYGGYACPIPEHTSFDQVYGYQIYESPAMLQKAYELLKQQQLTPLLHKGISCAIYTQLSDIEEEVNGLVTYDRRVEKF